METFVGDTVKFSIATGIDLSGYGTLQIKYEKPDGTTGCWAAAICPADTECMTYTCSNTDLDQAGEWLIQAEALGGGDYLHGQVVAVDVLNPLLVSCTTVAPTTAAP